MLSVYIIITTSTKKLFISLFLASAVSLYTWYWLVCKQTCVWQSCVPSNLARLQSSEQGKWTSLHHGSYSYTVIALLAATPAPWIDTNWDHLFWSEHISCWSREAFTGVTASSLINLTYVNTWCWLFSLDQLWRSNVTSALSIWTAETLRSFRLHPHMITIFGSFSFCRPADPFKGWIRPYSGCCMSCSKPPTRVATVE